MAGEPDQNRPTSSETGPPDEGRIVTRRVRRYAIAAGSGALLGIVMLTGMAAAQTEIGGDMCDGPIGTLFSDVLPQIIEVVILGGVAGVPIFHGASAFYRDAEKAKKWLLWRNRAGKAAIGVVPVAWLVMWIIGTLGFSIAECADPLPFL